MPAAYSVDEGPAGYSATLSAECSGTAEVGGHYICTVTNDDDAPSLTLVKDVTNDNGGTAVATDWTLTASGPTGFSGTTPALNGASFDAGTYDLSETGRRPATRPSAWVCVGGSQSDDDTIVIGLGDDVTCTITNDDDAPTLTLIKHVVNDNGGTAVATDLDDDRRRPTDFAGTTVFAGRESAGHDRDAECQHGRTSVHRERPGGLHRERLGRLRQPDRAGPGATPPARSPTTTSSHGHRDEGAEPGERPGSVQPPDRRDPYATNVGNGGTTGAVGINAGHSHRRRDGRHDPGDEPGQLHHARSTAVREPSRFQHHDRPGPRVT